MRTTAVFLVGFAVASAMTGAASAQPLGQPDRGEPGDQMIQDYLARLAGELHAPFAGDLESPARWQTRRPLYRDEYLYMLGLSPLPERTPLKATVTGTLAGDGFVVE